MSFLSPFAGLVVGTGGEGEGGEQGFVVSLLLQIAAWRGLKVKVMLNLE